MDRIKKAYRRKALDLHPDRNYGDVENATRRFAEVQSAYDVLSDAQERAWYDSHRDAILRNLDPQDTTSQAAYFHDVQLTTSNEILSLIRGFSSVVPLTDEPLGFFGALGDIFSRLATEEQAAGRARGDRNIIAYPPFGRSSDDHLAIVKPFYAAWSGFATAKSFAWVDRYKVSDAPDRRTRRLMGKENKKAREEGIRDLNDTVRFFVSFVRKRDPRVKTEKRTDAERQKSMREATATQAAKSRAANQKILAEATFQAPVMMHSGVFNDDMEEESSDSSSSIEAIRVECVVCNKYFKSEKQFETHERSKKHQKAFQKLQREMRAESLHLDLEDSLDTVHHEPTTDNIYHELVSNDATTDPQAVLDSVIVVAPSTSSKDQGSSTERVAQGPGSAEQSSGKEDDNEVNWSAETINPGDIIDDAAKQMSELTMRDEIQAPKKGKAKIKREKKAAKEASKPDPTVSRPSYYEALGNNS